MSARISGRENGGQAQLHVIVREVTPPKPVVRSFTKLGNPLGKQLSSHSSQAKTAPDYFATIRGVKGHRQIVAFDGQMADYPPLFLRRGEGTQWCSKNHSLRSTVRHVWKRERIGHSVMI